MREILFKGKRVYNGEWITSNSIMQTNYSGTFLWYEGCWREVISETVGQYTGLPDKNGKKIFEGDIIICDTSTYRYVTGTVKYSENASCYYIKALNSSNDYMFNCDNILIIIGNIHDNPELLEG